MTNSIIQRDASYMHKDSSFKKKEFEAREVFPAKNLKQQLAPTGYDAYRVSPRATYKHGKYYKRIYGATIEPDYSRGTQGNYGANVKWYPHGYTKANARSGTFELQSTKDYPVNQQEVRSKLMLKRK